MANIRILNDPVLIGELCAYRGEVLPRGLMRCTAPSGQHDDTVIALALAWAAVTGKARPRIPAVYCFPR
ncbi:MAG: hypothetical protein HYZ57_20275 [Acidobacteria bacterium]|nr:hypothetical protein [Acidobacteriota bacterium]